MFVRDFSFFTLFLCFLFYFLRKKGRAHWAYVVIHLAKKYNPNVKLVLAEEIGGVLICAGRDGEIPYGARL